MSSVPGTVLGYVGLAAYMLPVFPQIYRNFHRKDTVGLSILMFCISAVSSQLFAAYAYVANLPLSMRIQAYVFSASCCVVLAQVALYQRKFSLWKSIAVGFGAAAFLAMIQGAVIVIVQALVKKGVMWLGNFFVVLSTVLAVLQFAAQSSTIIRLKDARALSWLFLILYFFGATSFLLELILDTVLVPKPFDWYGASSFMTSAVCIVVLLILKRMYGQERVFSENVVPFSQDKLVHVEHDGLAEDKQGFTVIELHCQS